MNRWAIFYRPAGLGHARTPIKSLQTEDNASLPPKAGGGGSQTVWLEVELELQRKGGPERVAMAVRLRRETTMTPRWIAAKLRMGT